MALVTAEQVNLGHPDKFCDRISDSLMDSILVVDPLAHCAIETFACGTHVIVGGEVSFDGNSLDLASLVEETVRDLWESTYYDAVDLTVVNLINKQSEEISDAVSFGGAGDQGIMVGYAVGTEESNFLPREYFLASDLMRITAESGLGVLGTDAKCQVTLDKESGHVAYVVFSAQKLSKHFSEEDFFQEMYSILDRWVNKHDLNIDIYDDYIVSVNPGCEWTVGGPLADTGLTGRKIIADSYGPSVTHGGGAYSGKDCTKVDRSGAYMARCVAKNLVKQGLCSEATVKVAYQIGYPEPVMVSVEADGVLNDTLSTAVQDVVDWSPEGIKTFLGLDRPIFSKFNTFGHYTNPEAPWESRDIDFGLRGQ